MEAPARFGNACTAGVVGKKWFLMLCRNATSATEIRLVFAGTLQRPRRYGWSLQERCKCHGDTVGICRNAASATEIRLVFAGTLQTPKWGKWSLQEGGDTKKPERTLFSAYHSGLTSAHLTKPTDGQRNGNYQLISYSVVSSTTVASVAPDFLRERRVRPEPLRAPVAVLSMLVL